MNIRLFFIPLAVYFLIAGCARKLPENASELFGNWFVHPTESNREAIRQLSLTKPRVDSIVRLIRSQPVKTGTATIQIADEHLATYI
ncbi:MAG: hypothetical protein ACOCW2_02835, partial [Chitinivibrionales bacterium]